MSKEQMTIDTAALETEISKKAEPPATQDQANLQAQSNPEDLSPAEPLTGTMYNNPSVFAHIQRVAKMFSQSTLSAFPDSNSAIRREITVSHSGCSVCSALS